MIQQIQFYAIESYSKIVNYIECKDMKTENKHSYHIIRAY